MALGCESDGGLQQLRPRLGSEFDVRQFEAADIARHGGGAPTGHAVCGQTAIGAEEHVARSFGRRTFAEVKEAGSASFEADQDVAAARPFMPEWVTPSANPTATAASMALPPAPRIWMPVSLAFVSPLTIAWRA